MNAYKCAGSSSDHNHEFGQVRGRIWERVACVIGDSDVSRSRENRECSSNGKRESGKVCDRIMCDSLYRGILQRNYCTFELVY